MKEDRLEEFILDNREEFDSEIPRLNLFGDIEEQLNKPVNNSLIFFRCAAASVIIAIVFFAWHLTNHNNEIQTTTHKVFKNAKMEIVHPELIEAAEYYSKMINKNKSKLIAMNHIDPELFRDLEEMESMFNLLALDWENTSHRSDDRIINAMIDNYRNQLELLEDVISRIENNNTNNISLAFR